jgi:hypothetical protein
MASCVNGPKVLATVVIRVRLNKFEKFSAVPRRQARSSEFIVVRP